MQDIRFNVFDAMLLHLVQRDESIGWFQSAYSQLYISKLVLKKKLITIQNVDSDCVKKIGGR